MVEPASQPAPIRFGLRRRIIVRFAAIGLVLSTLFGVFTYVTVRQQLLRDRTEISIEQASADSLLVFTALQGGTANPTQVLASLRPRVRSTPLLLRDGEWFAASLQVRPEDLPPALVELVSEGQPARQRRGNRRLLRGLLAARCRGEPPDDCPGDGLGWTDLDGRRGGPGRLDGPARRSAAP